MVFKSKIHAMVSIAALSVTIAGSLPVSSPASASGSLAQVSSGIKVTMNGDEFQPNSAPYIKKGTVYLPLRDIGELLGSVVFWNSSSKTVTMTYPELTVKLNYGSEKATVNGKAKTLTAPLSLVNGRIYVPLRFLSEATGADVKWNAKTQTVSISQSNEIVKGIGVNSNIWLKRGTGELYIAHPYEQAPVKVGKVDADFKELISLNMFMTSNGNMLLTIMDNHGEPHINYDVYGVLVRNNAIVSQKKASYFQRYEENEIYYQYLDEAKNEYVERTLLTDGRTLSVFDSEGKEVEKYDLPTLAGKDENYAVLGAGKDYLVVRPNRSGFVTVIDLKNNTKVEMYDKVLTGDDLDYARNNDVPYHGDILGYLGEDTSTGNLLFSYDSPFDNKPIKVFTYNLKTGKTGTHSE